MPHYRIVRGSYRPQGGERAEPGDVVEIPESVADRLNDSTIERVDPPEADESAPETTEAEPEVGEAEADDESEADNPELADPEAVELDVPELPDDYSVLAKMAAEYEGDDIHGAMSGDDIRAGFRELPPEQVAELEEVARSELDNGGD